MAKNDIGGVWRTIGGRKVFIKDGESLSTAMKKSGKFKTASKGKAEKEVTFEEKREYLKQKGIDELNNFTKDDDDTFIRKEYDRQKALENETKQAQMEYEHAQDKYEHHKFDDNESESKQASRKAYEDAKDRLVKAQREEGEALAKEAGKSTLINEYNKTDSRGSMSDDAFIERARKVGMSDENIAKEVYKKHNGPESNNTSDNNIKRLLAKQKKEESLAKGDKDTASRFEKYEKEFESRTKTSESSKTNGDDRVKTLSGKYETDNKGREVTQKEYDEFRQAYKDGKISQEDYRNDNYDALKNITENKTAKTEAKNYMQDQFKAFDKGNISGADLEKAKRDSGLSKQEIEEARNYVNNRAPESYPRQTENKSGKTTSQAVPKKSTLNTMTEKNADIAEKIIEDDEWNDIRVTRYGNGNTVIENERTGKNIKITPSDTKESLNKKIEDSYKESKNSNDWVRNAFNDYKKEHPNTKMTLEQFKKSKK